ncbi:hypothetical protein ACYPJF_07715 [Stenotrophomonas geniculata]
MTTDNKTLAVDVLAVLRQIADGEGDAQVLAMRARAAVAELIEEAEKIEAFIHRVGMHCKQFSSALARVKGESA